MPALLPLVDVLGFVEECDVSDLEQQTEEGAATAVVGGPKEAIEFSKKRLPRLSADIVSLRAQLDALTIQLKSIKQTRLARVDPLLVHASYWRTEANHLSRLRAEAQGDNERLRSQLQAQKRFATRLVNMMKRRPSIRIMQTLDRYEQAAIVRGRKRGAVLDSAYLQRDAMLRGADFNMSEGELFWNTLRPNWASRFLRRVQTQLFALDGR